MSQFSNYLGQWIVNDPVDPQRCETINCIMVDEKTREAVFEDGKRISLLTLDTSNGKYEKLHSIYDAPEVKGNLGEMKPSISSKATPSEKLGDLSKIGHRGKQKINETLREQEVEIAPTGHNPEPMHFDNPVASFIASAIQLSRNAGTLSGGEAQRIRLATQIGSGLTGVLYILDEPSIGLHQRDNDKLLATLKKLRDLGNTLLVVEHDEDTMYAADQIIDIGPGAGTHGGQVMAQRNSRRSKTS